ncbi:hypothetical protein IE077_000828, partial [Cardiosporidium cionae]
GFCKGSPEIIQTLCLEASLPSNLAEIIKNYANKGMRVLAMAGKILDTSVEIISRDSVETELKFLGLMIFSSQLKSDTAESIKLFQSAGCFCAMATGDNALTAMAIAKECNIIK